MTRWEARLTPLFHSSSDVYSIYKAQVRQLIEMCRLQGLEGEGVL